MIRVKFRTALSIPYMLGIFIMLGLLLVFWISSQNDLNDKHSRRVLRFLADAMVKDLDSNIKPTIDFARSINKNMQSVLADNLGNHSMEDIIKSNAPTIFKSVPQVELIGYQDSLGKFFALKNTTNQYMPLLIHRDSKKQNYLKVRAGIEKSSPLVTKLNIAKNSIINNFVLDKRLEANLAPKVNDFKNLGVRFSWYDKTKQVGGENFITLNFDRLEQMFSKNVFQNISFIILDKDNKTIISSLIDKDSMTLFDNYNEAIKQAVLRDNKFSHDGKLFKKINIKDQDNKNIKFESLSFNYNVENLDWQIIIAIPSKLLASTEFEKQDFLSIVVLVALATLLFGFAIIYKLIAPLTDIVEATKKLAQGGLDTEVNLEPGYILETNTLVENVNHMSRQISASLDAIRYSLHHDSLTGLLNLKGFKETFNNSSNEYDGGILNLALISVKNFRVINGSFGRNIGDLIIQTLASRMRQIVPYDSLLVRIEGVDFALLVKTANKQTFLDLIEKLYKAISAPYKIENEEIMIKSRIGYVQENGMNYYGGLDIAIRKASIALSNAKNFDVGMKEFNENMMLTIVEQSNMENELYKASNRNKELLAVYQPVVNLQNSNKLQGAEALLRWNSQKHGMVYPNTFISIAEKSNLILNLDRWILNDVCSKLTQLKKNTQTDNFRMHVNLSTRQILQTDLARNVERILDKYGTDPSLLTIEITESVMIDMNEDIKRNLKRLRNSGIKIALDDFGTGYSSLSYLHQIEFDSFKIDQTFVRNVLDSKKNQSIVKAILAMAEGIGAEVVAEGVETAEQGEWLREAGCGYAQGYYYAKPLEFEELLLI